jgi:hypothetical protein
LVDTSGSAFAAFISSPSSGTRERPGVVQTPASLRPRCL